LAPTVCPIRSFDGLGLVGELTFVAVEDRLEPAGVPEEPGGGPSDDPELDGPSKSRRTWVPSLTGSSVQVWANSASSIR
jgi:hypothetical protein